jgi:formiminoglutamase
MKYLKFLSSNQIQDHVFPRAGEQKLGEALQVISDLKELENHPAQFVILGIQEDIGVRANLGKAGCANSFQQILSPLFNVQVNRFLNPESLVLGPYLDFEELSDEARHLDPNRSADLERLRELTSLIDQAVTGLIEHIAKCGKTPIVIGGGHNNSYGIIKGVSLAQNRAIEVLNIDPHADFRALEGRHSGNGFSYAHDEGFLGRYAVFGLHESYNNQAILETFRASADLYYLSYDELLIYSTDERDRLFKDALRWLGPRPIGLELDLDSITGFPVSALNASGFTMRQVRGLIKTAAHLAAPLYFHIAEGAPDLAENETERILSSKAMVYLITDFIKSHQS